MERGRGRGGDQLFRGRGRCQGQVFWPRGRGLNTTGLRSVEFTVKRVTIKLFSTYYNTVTRKSCTGRSPVRSIGLRA